MNKAYIIAKNIFPDSISLKKSKLKIISVNDLSEAAKKIIEAIK